MSKILVIAASNNKDGNSVTLARDFVDRIDSSNVTWVYLYDLMIDPFTNENRKALIEDDIRNRDIRELINKIESVDHVVITTPIWNFSVPSVLKGMLDRVMTSGRVWSDEKQKKVPGWKGKRFYLLFTMGAPWYGIGLNCLAVLQVYFTLKYFGASPSVVHIEPNSGNGSHNVAKGRDKVRTKLHKKARRYFRKI